jgi:adenosylcobinamide-phosphate synthase
MMHGLICIGAVLLDRWLGEPPCWHPLVGFGRLATAVENQCYGASGLSAEVHRWLGVIAVLLLIVPFALVAGGLAAVPYLGPLAELGLLYLAVGAASLRQHAEAVADALAADDLARARERVGRIVSRDTANLTTDQVSAATVESVLENGCDAIFGALFWFLLAGASGVVAYRLANTLDAMWGYRTTRYLYFGWAAARLDDGLNWLPARLTAASYVLLGPRPRIAWDCWRTQAPTWKSPNAGVVMATGAGALGLALGGPAPYHGEWVERPPLGDGVQPVAADIGRALDLVQRTLWLWLGIALLGGLWIA